MSDPDPGIRPARCTTRQTHPRVAFVIVVVALLSGCVSPGPLPWNRPEDPAAPQDTVREDESPPLFDTPEDTILATPWFSVSSVILRVTRTQRDTVIVLPEESVMRDYMRFDPNIVLDTDKIPDSGRLMFGMGIVTDGAPPFTSTPDRYRHPDLYD